MLTIHLLLMSSLASAFALTPAKDMNKYEPWCVNKTASIKKDQLQCLKATVQALQLRQIFTDVSNGRSEVPSLNPNGEIKKKNFVGLFKRPILIYEVLLNERGGYNVKFIFKDFLRDEFLAWFDFDHSDSLELQIVVDLGLESKKTRQTLQKKEFKPYWL